MSFCYKKAAQRSIFFNWEIRNTKYEINITQTKKSEMLIEFASSFLNGNNHTARNRCEVNAYLPPIYTKYVGLRVRTQKLSLTVISISKIKSENFESRLYSRADICMTSGFVCKPWHFPIIFLPMNGIVYVFMKTAHSRSYKKLANSKQCI